MLIIASQSASVYALDLDKYAEQSVLSSGKWVKIKVDKEGMQYISYEQLRSWGFKNPQSVNVYGYGGREISLKLDNLQSDDLPIQPIVRTGNGISFYGVNTTSWGAGPSGMKFIHSRNPYSDDSYYFLSDRETESISQTDIDCRPTDSDIQEATTIFTERIMHETDRMAPAQTGRLLLGEDFRTNPVQTFSFDTPGFTGDKLTFCVNFGVYATNGTSSMSFKANGKEVEATSSDKIPGITGSETFIRTQRTIKEIPYDANKLQLEIKFNPGGVLKSANLDYICINYPRSLTITDGQIAFGTDKATTFSVGGATSSTQIWDVTNPANPINVKYTLIGNNAIFTQAEKNREYIAFNPEALSIASVPTLAANIEQQDIHSMPVPQMLIISPDKFINEAERLAAMHRDVDGWTVHVLTPTQIYNEFSSGTPDVSAFRKLHKMWYDRSMGSENPFGYSILFGRATYDNRVLTEPVKASNYPRIPIWQSPEGTNPNTSYSTDDLIAMLDDNKTELNMSSAKLNISVGRIPVKSPTEAKGVTDKLINYVKNPEFGAWRNIAMIIADDQDNAIHLDQAQDCYNALRSSQTGKSFLYERLYLDAYPLTYTPTGQGYPLARERMFKNWKDGVFYVNYIGHANAKMWSHEGLLKYPDIIGMDNKYLPFFYTATCEFAAWDEDDVSGAEVMFLNPNAGSIGFISASRPVYISMNGILSKSISANVFTPDSEGKGRRTGDIYRIGKNYGTADDNKLRYLFMGDPAIRIPYPTLCAEVTEIGGVIPTEENKPIIPARGRVKVKGRIVDAQGNTDKSFNGTLIPTLYDAERPVETLANGAAGAKRIYNDRQNKLFTGKVPVINGEWETTILMPSEIDNNYSPALLNLYAYSKNGVEANGFSENLYVYGWDENAPIDDEGPVISRFTLNSDAFREGDIVNPTPLVLASMHDESGINISQSGIGHQISLTLDSRKVITEVANSYEPDAENPEGGHLAFLMPEIEPGEHTLALTVWDNAGNSSTRELNFKVSINQNPIIYSVTPSANPASTSVIFYISHDMPQTAVTTRIEIFDIAGRKVWQSEESIVSEAGSPAEIQWNLCDGLGARVPRGIYLYRTTLISPQGKETTVSRKLAVTAG